MPTMQIKRGSAAALASVNPTPLAGELVWDTTNNTLRVGNGSTAYSSLAIVSATPTDGSVTTAKIANDAVTYAKIQNVSATDRLLGRSSAGSGDVEEITCTAFGRSLIDDADAAAARTTLSVQPTASPAFTGAATFDNTGNVVPLTVTNTGTANSFVVNDASGDTSPFVIDASGNVGIGTSSPAAALDVGSGNLRFSSTAQRITGDFSNSTISNRLMFQTSTSNGNTSVRCIPNGTATVSNFVAHNGSDSNNTSFIALQASLTETIVNSGATGTGTYLPLTFYTNNAPQVQISTSGQLLVTAGSASAPGIAFSGDPDTGIAQLSAAGANTLSICTNSAEAVRVNASQNVGIGVSPTHRLDCNGEFRLRGAGASTEAGKLHLYWVSSTNRATWTTDASGNALIETGASAPAERFRVGVNGRSQFFAASEKYGVQLNNGSTANGPFIGSAGADIFTVSASGGAELLRVDASGNTCIGSAGSSAAELSVFKDKNAGRTAILIDNLDQRLRLSCYYESGVGQYAEIQSATDSESSFQNLLLQRQGGEVLIGTTTDQGNFKLQVAGNTYLENLYLSTTVNYGRLAISHAGATTFAAGWNNTDTSSTGQTTLNILRNGVSVGTISTTNAATSYNTTSDYRLKANPRPITDATERISRIKPSQWDWHVGGVGEGFIAHELVDAVPLAVTGEKDAVDATGNPVWQTVDMSKVVPVLVAALQESNARIAALEERLNHA